MTMSPAFLLLLIFFPFSFSSFVPCSLTTLVPGFDIAQNFKKFPNPFAWYTNPEYPGVTLPGPMLQQKCNFEVGVNFVWSEHEMSCVLNGEGYPLEEEPHCENGVYDNDEPSFDALYKKYYNIAENVARKTDIDGNTVSILNFKLKGTKYEAAMSIGHGVLGGKCGSCFIINQGNKYVFQLQTDVRAWSLELTGGANIWLSKDDYGGTCEIPNVITVNCEDVFQGILDEEISDPDIPDIPEIPDVPNIPDNSDIPDVPVIPEIPEVPEIDISGFLA